MWTNASLSVIVCKYARTQLAVTTANAMQTSRWIPKTQRVAYVSCNSQWCLPSLVICYMIILYHVSIKSYLLAFFFHNALCRTHFQPRARFLIVEGDKKHMVLDSKILHYVLVTINMRTFSFGLFWFMSLFSYAIEVWGASFDTKYLRRIDKFNKRAFRYGGSFFNYE